MSNPALAETLQKIADQGAKVLYNGSIADGIVAAVCSTFLALSPEIKCFCRNVAARK